MHHHCFSILIVGVLWGRWKDIIYAIECIYWVQATTRQNDIINPSYYAKNPVQENTYERMCFLVNDFQHDGEFVLLNDGNWNLVHGAACSMLIQEHGELRECGGII